MAANITTRAKSKWKKNDPNHAAPSEASYMSTMYSSFCIFCFALLFSHFGIRREIIPCFFTTLFITLFKGFCLGSQLEWNNVLMRP